MAERDYDFIIVGGRVAGSALAAHLGRQGMRVLLLERATHPFPPPISCPSLFPVGLALLDELGVPEARYAAGTPPVRRAALELGNDFVRTSDIPPRSGRDYCYGIERVRFDRALWEHAASLPSVTAREGFSVSGLLWDGRTVVGVRGRHAGGAEERFTAACVVGADGRFSRVASETGAAVVEERNEHLSSLFFAYWEGAAPYDSRGDPVAAVHCSTPGLLVNTLESADGRLAVAVQARARMLEPRGETAEEMYLRILREHPRARARLAHARRVTDVRGLRGIQNLYREPGGPGWALVGDAYHQKDPIDAQGLYDALFGARSLSLALLAWRHGALPWDDALAWYDATVRAETHDMFVTTVIRVKQELYTPMPIRMWRWVVGHPEYVPRFVRMLSRSIPAKDWFPKPLFAEALALGAMRDTFAWASGNGAPGHVPPAVEVDEAWYGETAREAARALARITGNG